MDEPLSATPWGDLPPSMRVLLIVGQLDTGGWLSEVFSCDSACRVHLCESEGIVEGLARLRDEMFDAVLICHDPKHLDALRVLDAIRTGSTERQPILVLGEAPEAQLAPLCFESGADAYLCLENTTTRMLLWHVARARERQRLLEENRALQQIKLQSIRREQDAAGRILEQQRDLAKQLCRDRRSDTYEKVSRELLDHYREILQAHVIMGGGNLTREMRRLIHMLVSHGFDGPRTLSLHIEVVDTMVRDLGNRSATHVINRADLLFIEVLLHLSERYRDGLGLEDFSNVQRLAGSIPFEELTSK